MGTFDPIVDALSKPGPVTDHSTHTTTQLPPYPQAPTPKGRIDTNQKTPSSGSFDQLRAGMKGPKPY